MPTVAPVAPRTAGFRNDQPGTHTPQRGIVGQLAAEWPRVCASPTTARLLRRWQQRHPALAGPEGLNQLLQAVDAADRNTQDRMLHALIQLAQSGQQLAARTLLQAMLPKLTKMSRRRGQTPSDDDYQLTVGHFWEVVHTYPLRRGTSVAANLALGTLNRVTRDRAQLTVELPEDPATVQDKAPAVDPVELDGQLSSDMDLMQLLAWALDRQILRPEQASLLARVYLPQPGQTSADIAADLGITVGALRWRCCRIVKHLTRAVAEDRVAHLADLPRFTGRQERHQAELENGTFWAEDVSVEGPGQEKARPRG